MDENARSVIRVIVVDDDPAFLAAATHAIAASADIDLVAIAASLADGLRLLSGEPVDVIVVDLGLPDGSGIALIEVARRLWPKCDIMVATVFGDEAHVIAAIEAGATGYLLKDSRPATLTAEIRSLYEGGSPISPIIARGLLARLHVRPLPQVDEGSILSKLSPREESVLDLITRGFSQGDVAAQLNVSQHTVRTFVRRIYLKLGVKTKSEAIQTALRLAHP